jgi:hypothetical protein
LYLLSSGPQEEGEYEYAADPHGSTQGKEEPHAEPAVLVQPLTSETGGAATVQPVPLCEGGIGGECLRDVGGVGDRRGGKKLWKALTKDERGSNTDAYCEATGGGLFITWIPGVGQLTAVGCAFRGIELLLK